MFALLALLKGHFTVKFFLVCEIIFEILCTKDRKSVFYCHENEESYR